MPCPLDRLGQSRHVTEHAADGFMFEFDFECSSDSEQE